MSSSGSHKSSQPKEKLVIVGSGVIGLSSAYYLSRLTSKFEIHVVEQRSAEALGASFQNGGVINVEVVEPINSYMHLVPTLRSSLSFALFGTPTNTRVHPRALLEPGMPTWLWHFCGNSSPDKVEANSRKMLKLSALAGSFFQDSFAHLGLAHKEHNFRNVPGLVLSHAEDPAAKVAAHRRVFGHIFAKQFETTPEGVETLRRQSGLLSLERFNCACVEPENLVVHTKRFCQSLRGYLESLGVTFHMNTKVAEFHTSERQVTAVTLESAAGNRTNLDADAVVVAAGYETAYLMKSLGMVLPLVPVKAYSAHVHNVGSALKLQYATLVSGSPSCLITPYCNTTPPSLRVTGIRDLDGFEPTMHQDRLDSLLNQARNFIGTDFVEADTQVWAGIMPVSPDDFPIVGPIARYDNLFVNTGHGFRGTNWSLVSGAVLAYSVLRNKPGHLSSAGVQSLCCDLEQLQECSEFTSPSRFSL